jgi:hypothetical protein
LHANGTLDASFDPGAGGSVSSEVRSLAIQHDGRILMGGTFTNVSGVARTNLARMTAGYAAVQSLRFEGVDSVVWHRSGAGPEFERVDFEGSINGVTFQSLGPGVYSNGAWRGENARLAQGFTFYLRARGRTTGGSGNASSSIVETTRRFFLPGNAPNPTASVHEDTGDFQLSFPYVEGIDLNVWATTDVTQPLSAWTSLGPAVEFAPRRYRFTEPETTAHSQRIYRVSAP